MLLATDVTAGAAQNPITRALLPDPPTSGVPTNAAVASRESIEEKLSKVRVDLTAVKALDDASGTNRSSGSLVEERSLRRSLLQRLVRLYEQQISFTSELQALKNRRL